VLHLTIWGLWTAALRPLSGDVVWEFVERAGNYGVPLAFLVLAGIPHRLRGWCAPVWPLALRPPTVTRVRMVGGLLRLTTCLLLCGHGALGALNNTPMLTAHYASIGLQYLAAGGLPLTRVIVGCDLVLAVAVLVVPRPSLLLSICLWKMATEALFMTAGALPFEWIERAGSYMAPLALYALVVTRPCRQCIFPCLGCPLPSAPHLPGACPGGTGKAPRCPSPARVTREPGLRSVQLWSAELGKKTRPNEADTPAHVARYTLPQKVSAHCGLSSIGAV
jgi:hypothetical protein